MAEVNLSDDEARLLRLALSHIVVKARTGELGIVHGLDRFVSTNTPLRGPDLKSLDSAAKKLGLANGVKRYGG